MADLKNMTLDDEVQLFLEQCAALAGQAVTESNKGDFRKLQKDEVGIRQRLNAAKDAEKRPHLDANAAIEANYKPKLASLVEALKPIGAALTKFMLAEEARLKAEAEAANKKAAEEAARAAELAAQAKAQEEDDPFSAFDAAEEASKAEAEAAALKRQAAAPVKVNVASSDGGRSGGLRTVGYDIEVTDDSALIAHYAHRAEFLELAITLAKREASGTKGQAIIPGATIIPIRKAA